jgi:glyoxylase-like metal-dependent hydrolase (beta-lactamase superfamily II)
MKIKSFVFNPIQENTYLVYDETGECIVIDAGCLFPQEEAEVVNFISTNNLTLKRVLNTHLHFDHAFGNYFLAKKYGVLPEAHKADEFMIPIIQEQVRRFGFSNLKVEGQPLGGYLTEGDTIRFGNTELSVLHVPGHSPGSLCYYCKAADALFSGDVLFRESIGRTDLPGGNYHDLINGITQKLLTLPENTTVYPGHGESTTIKHEKQFNPFL